MNISKLPSGSYRVRKMIDGKSYSVTLSYKPSKREAEQLIADKLQEKKMSRKAGKTFFDCAYDYIEIKSNVLSPTTVRMYRSTLNNCIPDWFNKLDIECITQQDIQKVINEYSINHAPKTTRNLSGFISSILGIYRPSMIIRTTLPQKAKNDAYIPSDDDIKKIFKAFENTEFEIPIKLCCLGLRRSEVCALELDDLSDDDFLTINKAKVMNEYNKWIIKQTKTTESTRTIKIPHELADLIRKQGFIYKGHPNSIYDALQRVQEQNGMKRFSLHKLRHYFCSNAHALGIPDAYIMAMGGWSTDNVMKTIYRHAMDDKTIQMQDEIISKMSSMY